MRQTRAWVSLVGSHDNITIFGTVNAVRCVFLTLPFYPLDGWTCDPLSVVLMKKSSGRQILHLYRSARHPIFGISVVIHAVSVHSIIQSLLCLHTPPIWWGKKCQKYKKAFFDPFSTFLLYLCCHSVQRQPVPLSSHTYFLLWCATHSVPAFFVQPECEETKVLTYVSRTALSSNRPNSFSRRFLFWHWLF